MPSISRRRVDDDGDARGRSGDLDFVDEPGSLCDVRGKRSSVSRRSPFHVCELRDAGALRRNPAVRMFCAQEHDFELNKVDDEELCAIGRVVRQLDGIPLALALAAAQRRLFTPLALAIISHTVLQFFRADSSESTEGTGRFGPR